MPDAAPPPPADAALIFAHALDPLPAEWLWPRRIPHAQLTLLVGDPGTGKSLLAADLAARISTGAPWPATAGDAPDLPDNQPPTHANSRPSDWFPDEAEQPPAGTNPKSKIENPKSPADQVDAPLPLRASVPSCLRASTPNPFFAHRPDNRPFHEGAAIIAAPEDHPTQILLPRLRAAGADLTRIALLHGVTHRHNNQWRDQWGGPPCPPTDDQWSGPPCPPTDDQWGGRPCSPADDQWGGRPCPPADDQWGGRPCPPTDGQWSGPSFPPPVSPLILPDHFSALKGAVCRAADARLLILDPLHAFLSPAAQSSAAVLGRFLGDLADYARTYNIAVLAVVHLAKSNSPHALYRVRGAVSLTAAARAVHLLTIDPNHPNRRILSPMKTVYGPPPAPLAFRIAPGPRLDWEIAPARPPADLLDAATDLRSALSEACDWLADHLAQGPRPAREAFAGAAAVGIARITLNRAKRILAVQVQKLSAGEWTWRLPDQPAQYASPAEQDSGSGFKGDHHQGAQQ